MAYQLRKEKKNGRIYLKIYFNFREPGCKNPRAQFVKSLGYVDVFQANGIEDPITHFQTVVQEMNDTVNCAYQSSKSDQIGEISSIRHLGYFPLQALMRKLDVQEDVELLTTGRRFRYSVFQCLCALIYARVVDPCSKKRTAENVIPTLYDQNDFSYETIRSCLEFTGSHYQKIVDIFTYHVKNTYDLDTSKTYFDCTNFFFEIDKEDLLRRKGPSKENRKDPIIGMGLLLDANAIPISMRMYPGNQSEKPMLRTTIKEMKAANNITGRTIQVADKGLNCASNIIAAVKDNDGYLFSKSVKQLPQKEKDWVLLNDGYVKVLDDHGKLKFKLKSCVDEFVYTAEDPSNGRKIKLKVREKRIVSYNPKLAEKQSMEIRKMVEKAKSYSLCGAKKSEYGECSKYVEFLSKDKNGELTDEPVLIQLREAKIQEDLALAGYNLLVTSETGIRDKEIYDTYHELWRIEETFRCTKSELDARPVYLQDMNRIYGHFLVCYLAVLLERLFQFKILENQFSSEQIYKFFRDFNIVKGKRGAFSNISTRSKLLEYMTDKLSLPLLNIYLNKTQIEKVLSKRL